MALFRSGLTMALTVFSLLGSSLAVPLSDKLNSLSSGARDLLKRSTPATPHLVVYDAWVSPLPSPSALSFWLTSGPADMAVAWQDLLESQRTSYLKEYNGAGISSIVSAFGETDTQTSSGANDVTYGLQGVDIDYEDFDAFETAKPATAEPWLISLKQLRTHLPQGVYSHSCTRVIGLAYARQQVNFFLAAVAPWFAPNVWNNRGYLLAIGKPAKTSDASNGSISPSELAKCVAEALGKGWG
ncbi:glycoside hydrolase family 18 protein [Tylopilus felleus]